MPEHQDWSRAAKADWWSGPADPAGDLKMARKNLFQEEWLPGPQEPGLDDPIGQALYAHQFRRTYASSVKEDEANRALEAVRAMSPEQIAELRGLLLDGARSRFLWLPCEGGFAPPLSEGPQRRER